MNAGFQPRQQTETSMSLNSSNPLLRWGHTSQPITKNLESGTPHEPINTSVLPPPFFPLSFPSPFHSFWNTISWVTTSPEAEVVTICQSLPVSHFLLLLKLSSLYLLSLSATPLCASHSFTKYTIPGGKSLNLWGHFAHDYVCVYTEQECFQFMVTFDPVLF